MTHINKQKAKYITQTLLGKFLSTVAGYKKDYATAALGARGKKGGPKAILQALGFRFVKVPGLKMDVVKNPA